jgi:hypothetical protein
MLDFSTVELGTCDFTGETPELNPADEVAQSCNLQPLYALRSMTQHERQSATHMSALNMRVTVAGKS